MKVSTRLLLGFGAVTAIGVGAIAYGAMVMNELSSSVTELATDRMVKVSEIGSLKDNFNGVARFARTIIITDSPAVREEEKKRVVEGLTATTELLKALDKTIRVPQARELLKLISDTEPRYAAALDRAMDEAAKGDKAAAGALLQTDVRPLQNIIFKALDDFRSFQQELASTQAVNATATAKFSTIVLVCLALLMGVIGTAVGWLLARSLRRSLGAEPDQLASAVGRVADGDLSQPLLVLSSDRTSVMAAMARMQDSLNTVVGTVRGGADGVASASSQIAQGNQDLSQRTEEQAGALEQTAATMDQLGSTVRTTADNAQQANQLSLNASTVATRGGTVVGQVVDTMKAINDSSKRVAEITSVIDGIAFQTNILALNAAVEAARAGEHGRGFAVVASEVRSLAQRSAAAAKEIKVLIDGSVEQVGRGTALVAEAGETMGEIVGAIRRVSDIVGEISAATKEQSTGVSQVGQAVGQMDQVTQQNAALVEESAAAAESLKLQAQQLVEAVAVFKLAQTSGGVTPHRMPAFDIHAIERPSLEPATNTARPDRKSKPAAQAAAGVQTALPRAMSSKTVSNEWESF
jgi:methyl-accepting chemotaxis protein